MAATEVGDNPNSPTAASLLKPVQQNKKATLSCITEVTLKDLTAPTNMNGGELEDIYKHRADDFDEPQTLEVSYPDGRGGVIREVVFVDPVHLNAKGPRIFVSIDGIQAMHNAISVLTRKVDNLVATLRACRTAYFKELVELKEQLHQSTMAAELGKDYRVKDLAFFDANQFEARTAAEIDRKVREATADISFRLMERQEEVKRLEKRLFILEREVPGAWRSGDDQAPPEMEPKEMIEQLLTMLNADTLVRAVRQHLPEQEADGFKTVIGDLAQEIWDVNCASAAQALADETAKRKTAEVQLARLREKQLAEMEKKLANADRRAEEERKRLQGALSHAEKRLQQTEAELASLRDRLAEVTAESARLASKGREDRRLHEEELKMQAKVLEDKQAELGTLTAEQRAEDLMQQLTPEQVARAATARYSRGELMGIAKVVCPELTGVDQVALTADLLRMLLKEAGPSAVEDVVVQGSDKLPIPSLAKILGRMVDGVSDKDQMVLVSALPAEIRKAIAIEATSKMPEIESDAESAPEDEATEREKEKAKADAKAALNIFNPLRDLGARPRKRLATYLIRHLPAAEVQSIAQNLGKRARRALLARAFEEPDPGDLETLAGLLPADNASVSEFVDGLGEHRLTKFASAIVRTMPEESLGSIIAGQPSLSRKASTIVLQGRPTHNSGVQTELSSVFSALVVEKKASRLQSLASSVMQKHGLGSTSNLETAEAVAMGPEQPLLSHEEGTSNLNRESPEEQVLKSLSMRSYVERLGSKSARELTTPGREGHDLRREMESMAGEGDGTEEGELDNGGGRSASPDDTPVGSGDAPGATEQGLGIPGPPGIPEEREEEEEAAAAARGADAAAPGAAASLGRERRQTIRHERKRNTPSVVERGTPALERADTRRSRSTGKGAAGNRPPSAGGAPPSAEEEGRPGSPAEPARLCLGVSDCSTQTPITVDSARGRPFKSVLITDPSAPALAASAKKEFVALALDFLTHASPESLARVKSRASLVIQESKHSSRCTSTDELLELSTPEVEDIVADDPDRHDLDEAAAAGHQIRPLSAQDTRAFMAAVAAESKVRQPMQADAPALPADEAADGALGEELGGLEKGGGAQQPEVQQPPPPVETEAAPAFPADEAADRTPGEALEGVGEGDEAQQSEVQQSPSPVGTEAAAPADPRGEAADEAPGGAPGGTGEGGGAQQPEEQQPPPPEAQQSPPPVEREASAHSDSGPQPVPGEPRSQDPRGSGPGEPADRGGAPGAAEAARGPSAEGGGPGAGVAPGGPPEGDPVLETESPLQDFIHRLGEGESMGLASMVLKRLSATSLRQVLAPFDPRPQRKIKGTQTAVARRTSSKGGTPWGTSRSTGGRSVEGGDPEPARAAEGDSEGRRPRDGTSRRSAGRSAEGRDLEPARAAERDSEGRPRIATSGREARRLSADGSRGRESRRPRPDLSRGGESRELSADASGGIESRELTADDSRRRESRELIADDSRCRESRGPTAEGSNPGLPGAGGGNEMKAGGKAFSDDEMPDHQARGPSEQPLVPEPDEEPANAGDIRAEGQEGGSGASGGALARVHSGHAAFGRSTSERRRSSAVVKPGFSNSSTQTVIFVDALLDFRQRMSIFDKESPSLAREVRNEFLRFASQYLSESSVEISMWQRQQKQQQLQQQGPGAWQNEDSDSFEQEGEILVVPQLPAIDLMQSGYRHDASRKVRRSSVRPGVSNMLDIDFTQLVPPSSASVGLQALPEAGAAEQQAEAVAGASSAPVGLQSAQLPMQSFGWQGLDDHSPGPTSMPVSRGSGFREAGRLSVRDEIRRVQAVMKAAACMKGGISWPRAFEKCADPTTGEMSSGDFFAMMRREARFGLRNLTDELLGVVFDSIDLSSNGRINYDDFIKWLRGGNDQAVKSRRVSARAAEAEADAEFDPLSTARGSAQIDLPSRGREHSVRLAAPEARGKTSIKLAAEERGKTSINIAADERGESGFEEQDEFGIRFDAAGPALSANMKRRLLEKSAFRRNRSPAVSVSTVQLAPDGSEAPPGVRKDRRPGILNWVDQRKHLVSDPSPRTTLPPLKASQAGGTLTADKAQPPERRPLLLERPQLPKRGPPPATPRGGEPRPLRSGEPRRNPEDVAALRRQWQRPPTPPQHELGPTLGFAQPSAPTERGQEGPPRKLDEGRQRLWRPAPPAAAPGVAPRQLQMLPAQSRQQPQQPQRRPQHWQPVAARPAGAQPVQPSPAGEEVQESKAQGREPSADGAGGGGAGSASAAGEQAPAQQQRRQRGEQAQDSKPSQTGQGEVDEGRSPERSQQETGSPDVPQAACPPPEPRGAHGQSQAGPVSDPAQQSEGERGEQRQETQPGQRQPAASPGETAVQEQREGQPATSPRGTAVQEQREGQPATSPGGTAVHEQLEGQPATSPGETAVQERHERQQQQERRGRSRQLDRQGDAGQRMEAEQRGRSQDNEDSQLEVLGQRLKAAGTDEEGNEEQPEQPDAQQHLLQLQQQPEQLQQPEKSQHSEQQLQQPERQLQQWELQFEQQQPQQQQQQQEEGRSRPRLRGQQTKWMKAVRREDADIPELPAHEPLLQVSQQSLFGDVTLEPAVRRQASKASDAPSSSSQQQPPPRHSMFDSSYHGMRRHSSLRNLLQASSMEQWEEDRKLQLEYLQIRQSLPRGARGLREPREPRTSRSASEEPRRRSLSGPRAVCARQRSPPPATAYGRRALSAGRRRQASLRGAHSAEGAEELSDLLVVKRTRAVSEAPALVRSAPRSPEQEAQLDGGTGEQAAALVTRVREQLGRRFSSVAAVWDRVLRKDGRGRVQANALVHGLKEAGAAPEDALLLVVTMAENLRLNGGPGGSVEFVPEDLASAIEPGGLPQSALDAARLANCRSASDNFGHGPLVFSLGAPSAAAGAPAAPSQSAREYSPAGRQQPPGDGSPAAGQSSKASSDRASDEGAVTRNINVTRMPNGISNRDAKTILHSH